METKGARQAVSPVAATAPARPAALRRTCACGSHTLGGAECETCRKKRQAATGSPAGDPTSPAPAPAGQVPPAAGVDFTAVPVPPLAALSVPGDTAERDADQRAAAALRRVRRLPPTARKVHAPSPLPGPRRSRRSGDDEQDLGGPDEAPAGIAPAEWAQLNNWLHTMANSGQPLPPELEAYFAARFGVDLSPIRVHNGPDAAKAAGVAAARAFAWGRHLIFATGAYTPETPLGRRLLAHELAHVFQEQGGAQPLPVIRRVTETAAETAVAKAEGEPASMVSYPLLVEDDLPPGPGQLGKTEFLRRLQGEVCRTAEEALSGTGWTAQDCPTLQYWYDYYAKRDAAHVERAVRRFAPGAAGVQNAAEYIPAITLRVRRGVKEWAASGRITEVPDELADVVAALAPPRPQAGPGGALQRKGRNDSAQAPAADPEAMRARLGSGQPLDSGLRSRMESAFGASFGHVRTHTDANGAALAREANARAFTVGEHIAFGSGEYQPGTLTGDALIAHELAHTLQQDRGLSPEAPGGAAEEALEEDANASAVGAVAALWAAAYGLPLRVASALRRIPRQTMPALRSGLQLSRCGFMVPNVQDVLYQETLERDGDRFDIMVLMDLKGTTTAGGSKTPEKLFNVVIRYAGEDDARREQVTFTRTVPDTGRLSNATVKRTQKQEDPGDPATTKDTAVIDAYGDGSLVATLTHRTYLFRTLVPPYRDHEFCFSSTADLPGWKPECRDIEVRDWSAELPKPGVTSPGAAAPTPGLESAKKDQLPTSTLMALILQRLGEIKPAAAEIAKLEAQVKADASSPMAARGADLRSRVQELNDTLVAIGPVFAALAALGNKEDYLPDIADRITMRAVEIKGLYVSALEAFYAGGKDREDKLAKAEKAMAAFPDLIVKLYLSEDGILKLTNQADQLRESLLQLRAVNGRAISSRPADRMIGLDKPGGTRSLANEIRVAIGRADEMRWKKDPGASKKVQELTYNAQVLIALFTTLLLYEQFIYWEKQLDDSFTDWIYHPKLGLARTYRGKLDAILTGYEKYGTGKTAEENQAFIRDGIDQVRKLQASQEYKDAVEAIQDRLKTIATINVLGKVALIAAAAALTAGAAGAAVGGAMEAAGYTGLALKGGVFVAETLAFTMVSQAGQTIAFGKPSDDFMTELAWNAAMFGVAKAAVGAYGRVFKIFADPKVYKITFEVGKIAFAAVALQGFAEAQHGLRTGSAMTGEERYRSILQNVILTVALEAGRFVTKPLEERVGAAVGAKLRPLFEGQLNALRTDRTALTERLGKLERHQATPEEVEQILRDIQDLWTKELKLLSDAVKRNVLSEAEAVAATAPYKSQIASLELRLSQLGVQAQVGAEGATFRPLERGVVAFRPEGRAAIDEYYKSRGGTLKESPVGDMLVGRLPSGELTFYLPEGAAPTHVASAAKLALVRDLALREAAGDAIAAEGLKRLQTPPASGGLGLGGPKADETLANVQPEDMNAFLRALNDPAFNQQLGADFFAGLGERPDAIGFARDYGADLLAQLYRRYGRQWSPSLVDALGRARSQLEAAPTPEARNKLRQDLLAADTLPKVETLLGNPPPPKPPRPSLPTKKDMGIDRSRPLWSTLRAEAQKFATDHGETLTSDQIDLRADGDQVIEAARRGGFDRLGRDSKLDILDRWEALAQKSGMQQTWINNKKGILSEAMFLPKRGLRKMVFKAGVEAPWGTTDATIPDYSLPQQGHTEWVNMKSDSINSGRKSGDVYQAGTKAATAYRGKAVAEAGNLPKGDKYSLDFIRDPGPETRNAMLKILFGEGSPIHRVKFGDTWYER